MFAIPAVFLRHRVFSDAPAGPGWLPRRPPPHRGPASPQATPARAGSTRPSGQQGRAAAARAEDTDGGRAGSHAAGRGYSRRRQLAPCLSGLGLGHPPSAAARLRALRRRGGAGFAWRNAAPGTQEASLPLAPTTGSTPCPPRPERAPAAPRDQRARGPRADVTARCGRAAARPTGDGRVSSAGCRFLARAMGSSRTGVLNILKDVRSHML